MDNKTERVATLEQQLTSKENKLLTLETIVTELRQKLRSDFYLFIITYSSNTGDTFYVFFI